MWPLPGPKCMNKIIDLFKNVIRKMCIEAIVVCPDFMNDVSDQYKTREMYIRVVEKDPG